MPTKDNLIPLGGIVEEIIYYNEENGYTVCDVDVAGEPVTMTGTMPYLGEGEQIRAMGVWTSHPTYGRQFKVSYFEKEMPSNEAEILRYLSSGAIKGVGPKTAERIVKHFGAEAFDIIENNPAWLAEIPGISAKKAREISDSFNEQFGVRRVMMYFSEFFGMALSLRIYKKWGAGAVDIVGRNPYLLCREIRGIGFEKADNMAQKLGLESDSPERIRAGVIYALGRTTYQNGHTYLPRSILVRESSELLGVGEAKVSEAISKLVLEGDLCQKKFDSVDGIYLTEMFSAECSAASKLIALSRANLLGSIGNADELIASSEKNENIGYEFMQKEAIKSTLDNPVTIITGGPGTGKTTIIKAVINIFRLLDMKILLAAPTGRAAKRMSEATGCEAKTLHRLLEMNYSEGDQMVFARDEGNPLECDVVIVDEFSMVDITLLSSLLKAVRIGTRLIFIGDCDQLPSVGPGNVLKDLINSRKFTVCRLNRIYRQAENSTIVENAHRINGGEYPIVDNKSDDFFFISRATQGDTAKTVVDLVSRRLPAKYGDSLSPIQVLAAARKGENGVYNLNLLLQAELNPPSVSKNERPFRDIVFREGDRVMQTRNNYDLSWVKDGEEGVGVFNGDMGTIISIPESEGAITVDFDGRICEYDPTLLEDLEHAYAATVHKSQGNEYPAVIVPVFSPPPMLAARNLLYTAVTRAKSMVVLVGRKEDIFRMVDNNHISVRYTGLEAIIRSLADGK